MTTSFASGLEAMFSALPGREPAVRLSRSEANAVSVALDIADVRLAVSAQIGPAATRQLIERLKERQSDG